MKFFDPTMTSLRTDRDAHAVPAMAKTAIAIVEADAGRGAVTGARHAPRKRKNRVGDDYNRRRQCAGEDHRRVDHRQTAEDVVAEAAGANRRRDRGRPDADDDRHAQPRYDRRQGQGPFHAAQHLARCQAHGNSALNDRRGHT